MSSLPKGILRLMDLLNRVPARFVKNLSLELGELGRPQIKRGDLERVMQQDFRDAPTIVLNDEGVWHYFHFMETMIWLWTIQHLFLHDATPKRIVFLYPWDNPHQNHVQRAFLKAAYPEAEIYDHHSPFPVSFRSALIIDRAWAHGELNKFNEDCLDLDFGTVRRRSEGVRRSVGAFPAKQIRPRATYVTRRAPRCLNPDVEERLLAILDEHFDVMAVDFAQIPWEQQVRLSAATDLMIGVHGNGLTNSLWMRPKGLVIEFFPVGVHHYDYQLVAELAGLSYFGIEGEKVFPLFCRVDRPYGHTPEADKPVNTINFDRLLVLIRTWDTRSGNLSVAPRATGLQP